MQICKSSPKVEEYLKHVKAVETALEQETGSSVVVSCDKFSEKLIADICDHYSTKSQTVVCMVHKTEKLIEIAKLPQKASATVFGKHFVGKADKAEKSLETHLVKLMREFIGLSWQDAENYCGAPLKAAFEARLLPYAYIQRRLASVAAFRRHASGSTAALKLAISICQNKGYIEEVETSTMKQVYGTTSKAYRILEVPNADA